MSTLTYSRRLKLAVFFFLAIAAASCENESELGLEVQPENRRIGIFTVDTFSIEAKQRINAPVISDQNPTPFFGVINDANFGLQQCGYVVQVRLAATGLSFSESVVVDSAFLAFRLAAQYGSSSPLDFEVYSISNALEQNETYKSDFTPNLVSKVGEIMAYEPNFIDSVIVFNGRELPQMRIPVDVNFADDLLKSDVYSGNTALLAKLPGLYVKPITTPAANQGYFVLVDPLSSLSRLVIYYREDAQATDTKVQNFPINSESVQISTITEDFTTSAAATAAADPNGTAERIYISGLQGWSADFIFPTVKNLKSTFGDVIINQAILRLNLTESSANDSVLRAISKVFPSIIYGSDLAMTPDFSEGSTFLDGNRKTNNTYDVNITRYIQWLIDDKLDFTTLNINAGGGIQVRDTLDVSSLSAAVLSSTLSPGRATFVGLMPSTEIAENRVKLIVSFTPVNLN